MTYDVAVTATGGGTITALVAAGNVQDAAGNASNKASPFPAHTVAYEITAPITATVTTPANGGSFRGATVPASFSGSVADNTGGVGLNANSATFTLKRSTDNFYWTGSAWQSAAFSLAATNLATTSNTAATWTSSATLPTWASQSDGTYTVQATATDKAGNTFTGTAISVTLATPPPAVPSTPDMTAATDSGVSSTDNITSVTTPTFTGTADAGSTVTLLVDGVARGTATATAGSYSITTTALAAGTHSVTATAADAAGNVSAASAAQSITVDTVKPAVTVNQAASQADPTNAVPVHFTVAFSEAVYGFTASS